jgi:hypothetical protein
MHTMPVPGGPSVWTNAVPLLWVSIVIHPLSARTTALALLSGTLVGIPYRVWEHRTVVVGHGIGHWDTHASHHHQTWECLPRGIFRVVGSVSSLSPCSPCWVSGMLPSRVETRAKPLRWTRHLASKPGKAHPGLAPPRQVALRAGPTLPFHAGGNYGEHVRWQGKASGADLLE